MDSMINLSVSVANENASPVSSIIIGVASVVKPGGVEIVRLYRRLMSRAETSQVGPREIDYEAMPR
jgi:hypothetical protein